MYSDDNPPATRAVTLNDSVPNCPAVNIEPQHLESGYGEHIVLLTFHFWQLL